MTSSFQDSGHLGSKTAILTSPHGAEQRAPKLAMLKFLHSLSQAGIVLTAQHSWRPSGLASVCLRVKNPQELLELKMISPAPETSTQYRSTKVVEGREGSSHQLHLPLHSLPGPISVELLLE